jgi:hypothetical protein
LKENEMKARVTEDFVASFEDATLQPKANDILEDPFASFCVSNGLPVEAIEDAPAPEATPQDAPAPPAPEPVLAPVPQPPVDQPAVPVANPTPESVSSVEQPPIEG